jgi:hypothetical protein
MNQALYAHTNNKIIKKKSWRSIKMWSFLSRKKSLKVGENVKITCVPK